jgi:hypothetical protein
VETGLEPYAPYVALTAGYLWLRYVLFGQLAREETLTAQRLNDFAADSASHLKRLVFGDLGMESCEPRKPSSPSRCFSGASGSWRDSRRVASAATLTRTLIYFGLGMDRPRDGSDPRVGVLLSETYVPGIAPAGPSCLAPRLSSSGNCRWPAHGVAPSLQWPPRCSARTRFSSPTSCCDWGRRSDVSARAVLDLEREIRAAPAGTLVIAGAPRSSWAFAIPFVLRPPFVSRDLSPAARVVSISRCYCCLGRPVGTGHAGRTAILGHRTQRTPPSSRSTGIPTPVNSPG